MGKVAKRGKTASLLKSIFLYFEYFNYFSIILLLLITILKYYTFAKKQLPIYFHLADRRSRSGGVIFKILTFLKCPKKHFFLVITLFGILNQIFPKINFLNVWAFSFYVWLDFFISQKFGILLKILRG